MESQDLTTTCTADVGGDLALVVDNSGSEDGYLDSLQTAASDLVNGVLDAGGQASLVRVSTNVDVLVGLTDDGGALYEAIDGMEINGGWTALWDGARVGNETLGGIADPAAGDLDAFCGATGRVGIALFTDGQENNSEDQQDYDHAAYPGDGISTRVEDLYALHSGGATTPIYVVGLGADVDAAALGTLADETGGRYLEVADPVGIGDAFAVLDDYLTTNQRVCADIPTDACGTLWVKVAWELDDGNTVTSGEKIEQVSVECPVDSRGRTELMLLTLGNPGIDEATAGTLAQNAVDYVASVENPTVLVVLDENHHDEYADDANYVADLLATAGYTVTRFDEKDGGLQEQDIAGYDVVWYSNPGYPMDDLATRDVLLAYSAAGGALVLQGDDMAWSWGGGFSMSPLTNLVFQDNGTQFCGTLTDDNAGSDFRVTIGNDESPAIAGLQGTSFLYGDDIDTSTALGLGESVVATATLDGAVNCLTVPVIVTIDAQE